MGKIDKPYGIGIIGCGVIGHKRSKALGTQGRLVACADVDIHRAENLAKGTGAKVFVHWQDLVDLPEVDIVIVSTTNDWLTPISLYALEQHKHILVEKPAARNLSEIRSLLKKAKSSSKNVKIGFNLRFHPAIMKARQIVDSGILGELMFVRGRYGHGGRVGYEKEWRADPKISGGGELIDQGVHMIDLCRWFLGDFVSVKAETATYFWDMPVEDNAFLCLSTRKNQIAWVHVSCTEWKNMFSLEIYGKTGKIQIDGLGGSYGVEKLTHYQMLPQMGPPKTSVWEYPGEDISWNLEFKSFIESINTNSLPIGNINDAYEALKIVDQIYK